MAQSMGGFLSFFDLIRRQAGAAAGHDPILLPRTEDEIAQAAAIGLAIPDIWMPGVVANMILLARHATRADRDPRRRPRSH